MVPGSQDFLRMPCDAGFGQLKAPIGTEADKSVISQALQAWAILQTGWPSSCAGQAEPVQCGSAAGFEIGLVPHSGTIVRTGSGSKRLRA